MRIDASVVVLAAFSIVVESSAWSLSNIMISGSKASDTYTESVLVAVEKGLEECRHQFRWDKWGCPKSSFNVFSKSDKEPATKESAFLHALISSSIVLTLTRNCSLGHFDSCGCDDSKRGDMGYKGWSWGGCSDNVKVGNRMAKHYLDAKENGRDIKALINLHNNRVGRMMVKKTMQKMCKCHGVSGSCETQTCWMRVQDLRHVGDRLKDAYDHSEHFPTNRNGIYSASNSRRRLSENSVQATKIQKRDSLGLPRYQLVYLENSPNFCLANASAGISGTIGRECSRRTGKNVPEAERSSCKNLCRSCGRRVQRKDMVRPRNCRCKFYWCCKVKCDVCLDDIVQHVCV